MVELIRKRPSSMVIPGDDETTKRPHQVSDSGAEIIGMLLSFTSDLPPLEIKKSSKQIIIGRSSQCDYKVEDSLVSSKHCYLSLETILIDNVEKINLVLVDTSSNGTYLNDEKLRKGEVRAVASGDHIRLSNNAQFIFKAKNELTSKYIMGKALGSGHFAEVKEAINRDTNSIVAIKVFHPNRRGELNKELVAELEVMMKISHPNIIKFHQVYTETTGLGQTRTCLVLEKANGGELFNRIITKGKLREDETKVLFKQLLGGLQYLHEHHIIHRDLKPENILLDIKPRKSLKEIPTGPWDQNELDIQVKIADFGLAKFIGELRFTNTLCGTPAYVAPEVLIKSRRYNKAVDIWSIGVLLYVCLCGFPPFSEELAPPSMRDQILTGKYAFYSPYWDPISDSALDLISKLLIVDPEKRLDVLATRQHYWFRDSYEQDEAEASSCHDRTSSFRVSRENTNPIMLSQRFGSKMDTT